MNVSKYVIIAASSVIFCLMAATGYYAKSYSNLKKEFALVEAKLELQNALIKENEIKLADFEKSKSSLKKNIEIRYREITKVDESCQSELNAIKIVVDTFFSKE